MTKRNLILIFALFHLPVFAQENLTAKKEIKISDEAKMGWTPVLKLSSNYSINSSKNVVGQNDGDSVTLGVRLDSAMNHRGQQEEWRNSLKFEGSTTKTPTIPRYVKSADSLKLQSLYLYSLESFPKVGPYVSVSAVTSAFMGEDVQPSDKTYQTPIGNKTLSSLRLTDGFSPLTTTEAAGFFYKAIARPHTKLEFRFGLGAVQVQADDQLRVKEVTDTTITIEQLESYSQAGLEYGLSFKGRWNETSDYSLTADFLTPLGQDIEEGKSCYECDDLELTNIEIIASTSTKASDWATISYEYKAVRKPQLLDKFQIQHGFVLNIAYDFFK